MILGPYNPATGELWACDEHDMCNGVFLGDGSYAYVTTATYPYVVGCWGPAPPQLYETECSQRSCGAPLGSIYIQLSVVILAISALFLTI